MEIHPKIITVARLDPRKSHQNVLMTIKNLKKKKKKKKLNFQKLSISQSLMEKKRKN